jgi:magnesium-transporting ATPase (P-type)
MFFKNIVYVIPIFCLGYYSYFSATVLYNDLLYQFYNLVFTSWPIVIFTIYDFQYEKAELLKNHKHYRIGFNSNYYIIIMFR